MDPEVLRAATTLSRWRSIALCVAIHAAVVGLAWWGGRGSGYRLAVPAILIVAGLQNHLSILMHEGAHGLLHPDRRANDVVADWFCAIPIFTLVKHYRIYHLDHHRWAGSPARDPEVEVYAAMGYDYRRRGPLSLLRMLAADLSGLSLVRFARWTFGYLAAQRKAGRLSPVDAREYAMTWAFWGLVALVAWRFQAWREVFLFWFLPALTLAPLLFKLHGYGEHTGATGPTEFERTWVHAFNPVADFFIYPIRSGYHLEHHFFPRVPWYRMMAFRRALLAEPAYAAASAPVTADGFFFGRRTILSAMLLGRGAYREDALSAEVRELGPEVVDAATGAEVDGQRDAGSVDTTPEVAT